MYKSLSPSAIGVFARQSELVEIALTHRFKGIEIELGEVLRRAAATSVAQACRYLCSAQVRIGGFDLPTRWGGAEAELEADLASLPPLLEVCTTLGADRCFTSLRPTCDQRPFHENFQFHVERLQKVADALAPAGVKLGLRMAAAADERADGGFQFIHQVDPLLLLVSSIRRDNVGIELDAWSWWVGGGDVEKVRGLRADQILSVRLADIPAATDLATITADQRLMPGEGGVIDATALLAALDEMGYDGPVAVAPARDFFKGQKREAIVSQSSAALDSLLGSLAADKPLAATGQP